MVYCRDPCAVSDICYEPLFDPDPRGSVGSAMVLVVEVCRR
jgi:hypothetical protein